MYVPILQTLQVLVDLSILLFHHSFLNINSLFGQRNCTPNTLHSWKGNQPTKIQSNTESIVILFWMNWHTSMYVVVDCFQTMHDLEGGLQYEMKLMLQEFILREKYITLDEFNARIECFDLGYMEEKDRPSVPSGHSSHLTLVHSTHTGTAHLFATGQWDTRQSILTSKGLLNRWETSSICLISLAMRHQLLQCYCSTNKVGIPGTGLTVGPGTLHGV